MSFFMAYLIFVMVRFNLMLSNHMRFGKNRATKMVNWKKEFFFWWHIVLYNLHQLLFLCAWGFSQQQEVIILKKNTIQPLNDSAIVLNCFPLKMNGLYCLEGWTLSVLIIKKVNKQKIIAHLMLHKFQLFLFQWILIDSFY